jgi:hypothetical protein
MQYITARTTEDIAALGPTPPGSPVLEKEDVAVHPADETTVTERHAQEPISCAGAEEEAHGAACQPKSVGELLQAQRAMPFKDSADALGCVGLQKVNTHTGGINCCLMYSYLISSGQMKPNCQTQGYSACTNPHSIMHISQVRALCRDAFFRVKQLRQDVHEILVASLPDTPTNDSRDWSYNMTRERVRASNNDMPRMLHAANLLMLCATLQAEEIMKDNKFLTEHHCIALANMHDRDILIFQDRAKKNVLGSKVDMIHYQPGFKPPTSLSRHEAVALMKKKNAAPIPIHLNASVSHFSGLVPAELNMAGRSRRETTKAASAVISLI